MPNDYVRDCLMLSVYFCLIGGKACKFLEGTTKKCHFFYARPNSIDNLVECPDNKMKRKVDRDDN